MADQDEQERRPRLVPARWIFDCQDCPYFYADNRTYMWCSKLKRQFTEGEREYYDLRILPDCPLNQPPSQEK